MTRADRIVVAVVAALAIASWPIAALASGSGRADTVVITSPRGTSRFALSEDRRVTVEGLRGPVVIVVVGGSVRVASAPCPDALCVHQGAVSTAGSSIVCVPNAVTVRIGGGADAPDALVR